MNDRHLPAEIPAASIGAIEPLGQPRPMGHFAMPRAAAQEVAQPPQLLSTLYRGRWIILGSTAFFLLIGIAYATFTQPVYRSGLLIQVEPNQDAFRDSIGGAPQTPAASTGNLPSAAASTEIEVLRSRMVMSNAVENLKLYIKAAPRYIPVIGWFMAAHSSSPSSPLPGGYVYGDERIDVPLFDVPGALEDKEFQLTLGADGTYTLKHSGTSTSAAVELEGKVGTLLRSDTPDGPLQLMVARAVGEPGASFTLTRRPKVAATESLQRQVGIAEQGKDSGVIAATLDGLNPLMISRILNEIGNAYVEQNAKRKSEAADKSIKFLDEQLPQRKAQLEEAESRYNAFRAKHGAVNTTEEGTTLLQQTVADQTRIVELKERRDDLLTRFVEGHPAIKAVDGEIAEAEGALAAIAARTRELPLIEQNVIQLQRDVQVDSGLYTSLLNARQQLTLVRAARVPNVRILDLAAPAEYPIKPLRGLVIAGAGISGVLIGVLLAFLRRRVMSGVEEPLDIEWDTGLPVFATVLRSQLSFEKLRKTSEGAQLVLAPSNPRNEAAIESLRTFRTTLQFALADAPGSVVLLTGPTAGVGKSFLSANLAILSRVSEKRILLIDADLRKGVLHNHFRVPRGPGLADAILGSHRVEDVIHREVTPGVDLLTAGTHLAIPSEIFLRSGFDFLIKSLSERYDMVVMDGPPVLLVADAIALGKVADVVFLVARHGVSTMHEIRESARRMALADVPIRGVVFNDFTPGPGSYGYPYAGYYSAPWTPGTEGTAQT
jgi:tyrosine-protein kinase Etk/Wzc